MAQSNSHQLLLRGHDILHGDSIHDISITLFSRPCAFLNRVGYAAAAFDAPPVFCRPCSIGPPSLPLLLVSSKRRPLLRFLQWLPAYAARALARTFRRQRRVAFVFVFCPPAQALPAAPWPSLAPLSLAAGSDSPSASAAAISCALLFHWKRRRQRSAGQTTSTRPASVVPPSRGRVSRLRFS